MATLVTATCGTDVVGWSPDGASAQQKVFELQHRARVSGTGWLPKGKALAVAGNDCVVNIYSMPDKKVAATVPKAISLPANPPTITALALSQANVLYGSSDGSINIAKLPDVKVSCLYREEGHPISDLVVTPQNKLVSASSHNGNVLLMPFEHQLSRAATYLSCKDRESRRSLSASPVGERLACGSHTGGIHIWDATNAAALHFLQDGDEGLSVAFQAQSQDVIFCAGTSKTLGVWDCRALKKATQVDLVKPASSIAAGMAQHDVAIGDAVGVAWLYDMRKPDTPRLRLQCGPSHAVTSMQWVPRPSSLDSRSYANRKAAIAPSSGPAGATALSSSTGTSPLHADDTKDSLAGPTASASTGLPRAPGALREQHRASMLAPHPLEQTLRSGETMPVMMHRKESVSAEHDGRLGNDGVAGAAGRLPHRPSMEHAAVGRSAGIMNTQDQKVVAEPQNHGGSCCVSLHDKLDGQLNSTEAANEALPVSIVGLKTELDVQHLQRVTEATVERVMDTHITKLTKHFEGVESRILSRILARSSTESPAYHTQQVNDHLDKTSASIKRDVQTWLAESHQETLKQFHLAQQDLMDVAGALSHQIASLTTSVEQLQARITADEENRRKVAQFM